MSACAACAAEDLRPHLDVSGRLGPEGLIPTTSQFGTALADIVRCAGCGHMQLHPMPDRDVLARAYTDAASEDYVGEEAGQRATARRVLRMLEAHGARPGSLADLGCWVGFLLAEARVRGWDTLGVEPSEFASTYARDRLGLNVLTADLFSTALPRSGFDAITMGDVIEHLIDPAEALRRIGSMLAPTGTLWMALPDAGSLVARCLGRRWWSVLPTHVQYFTRHSMTTLLHRCGFDVLELTSAPKAFTVEYYVSRVGGYSPHLAEGLVGLARRVGLAERMWAPDFHDRMAVIARPRALAGAAEP